MSNSQEQQKQQQKHNCQICQKKKALVNEHGTTKDPLYCEEHIPRHVQNIIDTNMVKQFPRTSRFISSSLTSSSSSSSSSSSTSLTQLQQTIITTTTTFCSPIKEKQYVRLKKQQRRCQTTQDCKTIPIFGTVFNQPICCFEHAISYFSSYSSSSFCPLMLVKPNEVCLVKKCCNRALFAPKNTASYPMLCENHQNAMIPLFFPDDLCNVMCKICERAIAWYGQVCSFQDRRCAMHPSDHGSDVEESEENTCMINRDCCDLHRLRHMICHKPKTGRKNKKPQYKCMEEEHCSNPPFFSSRPHTRANQCFVHRNNISTHCSYAVRKVPCCTYCMNGMTTTTTRCCSSEPRYGKDGFFPERCEEHREPDMILFPHRVRCIVCDSQVAVYGRYESHQPSLPKYCKVCVEHVLVENITTENKIVLVQDSGKVHYCCCKYHQPSNDYTRVIASEAHLCVSCRCLLEISEDDLPGREYVVVTLLKEAKLTNYIHDQPIGGELNLAYRPDFYFPSNPTRAVMLEVDEYQHISFANTPEKESERMIKIWMTLSCCPLVFVRYNPDLCIQQEDMMMMEVEKQEEKDIREQELLYCLSYFLSEPFDVCKEDLFMVVYIGYSDTQRKLCEKALANVYAMYQKEITNCLPSEEEMYRIGFVFPRSTKPFVPKSVCEFDFDSFSDEKEENDDKEENEEEEDNNDNSDSEDDSI